MRFTATVSALIFAIAACKTRGTGSAVKEGLDEGGATTSVMPQQQAGGRHLELFKQQSLKRQRQSFEWRQKTAQKGLIADAGTPDDALQDGCVPQHLMPEGQPIGLAIVVHGWTACPGQMMGIAEAARQAGYEVFVPLLPGHGTRDMDADKLDEEGFVKGTRKTVKLPKVGKVAYATGEPGEAWELMPRNAGFFSTFGDELVAMAEAAPYQKKAIIGLSVGGAIAAYAASIKGGNIFTHSLIVAPFLTSGFEPAAQWWMGNGEELGALESSGWGGYEGCFSRKDPPRMDKLLADAKAKNPKHPGSLPPVLMAKFAGGEWGEAQPIPRLRDGICTFSRQAFDAAIDFGHMTRDMITSGSRQPGGKVQFMLVEKDGAAQNKTSLAARNAFIASRKNSGRNPQDVSTCIVPKPAEHAFLNGADRPSLVFSWLPAIESATTRFLRDDQPFPNYEKPAGVINTRSVIFSSEFDLGEKSCVNPGAM